MSAQLKANVGYERDYKNMYTQSSLLDKDMQSHNQVRVTCGKVLKDHVFKNKHFNV